MPSRGRAVCPLSELPTTRVIDGHERVAGLVRIGPECQLGVLPPLRWRLRLHHLLVSSVWGHQGRSVDTPELGAKPRSYQVTPTGPVRASGQRHIHWQTTPCGEALSLRANWP